jgi:hypothetical protein
MLKSVSSITNAIGALNYEGTWDASANSPTLASGVGTKGDYYVVSVAGATALDGISNWGVGDWATFNGSVWQRVEGGANLNGVDLSVSGTASFAAGTALLPSITKTGDTNTGIWFPSGDTIAFTEGGVESMRINSSGNVGIGTTSPQGRLNLSNAGAAGFEFFVTNPGGGVGTYIQSFNRSGGAYVETHYLASSHTFRTDASATSMILDTGGIVTMSAYGAGAATFSAAGVISSVSDETWKIKDGVPVDPDAMLKKLEPGYWYYNDEKKETFGVDRQLGFYAQNVNAAIGPEAAPQPQSYKSTDADGNETTVQKPWGYYDRSVLAVVVMSLQKALDRIESLETKIAILESKI